MPDKLTEILEELSIRSNRFGATVEVRETFISHALSAIYEELKNLVEDEEIIGETLLSNPYENALREMLNKSNALWRTKLAERFGVK
jgi:hypothetical protein